MHAVLLAEHKIQTETDRLLHLIGPSLPAGTSENSTLWGANTRKLDLVYMINSKHS